jgi:hypothetical protein
MTHQAVQRFLAIGLLSCIGIVLAIDAAADYRLKVGLNLKWSLLWYACRYVGSVCAAVLALGVLL